MYASTLTDAAALLVACSLVVTAVAGAYVQIRSSLRLERKVDDVHDEVRTGNGQTIGMLADIAEGRAAQAIPVGERTDAEQHHADMKVESQGGPPSRPPDA